MSVGARRIRNRIPKSLLYEIVGEARKCGIGPRELGRAIGYSHEHLSYIARHELNLPPLKRNAMGHWPDRLRDMAIEIAVGHKQVDGKVEKCCHCGGILRPLET